MRPNQVHHRAYFASYDDELYHSVIIDVFTKHQWQLPRHAVGTLGKKRYYCFFSADYRGVKKSSTYLDAFCAIVQDKAGKGGRILLSI